MEIIEYEWQKLVNNANISNENKINARKRNFCAIWFIEKSLKC